MKDDAISRQAAIEALKDMYRAAEKWGEEASDDVIKARAESCMASLVEMKLRIEKLPSAQQERKEGRWENGYCTQCGNHALYWAMSSGYCASNFCPNCGAKMGGEKE